MSSLNVSLEDENGCLLVVVVPLAGIRSKIVLKPGPVMASIPYSTRLHSNFQMSLYSNFS